MITIFFINFFVVFYYIIHRNHHVTICIQHTHDYFNKIRRNNHLYTFYRAKKRLTFIVKLIKITSYMMKKFTRKLTRQVAVRDIPIGGTNPISVQSMTNTDTCDVAATTQQIHQLEKAGCEIVRVAVPNEKAVTALPEIIKNISIPLIADIHFNYRLALASIAAGVHKLRINPGNIGGKERFLEVLRTAKERAIPMRIGVNAGSLESDLLKKYKGPRAEALIDSVMRHITFCRDNNYEDLVLSLKASDVATTIQAYRLISDRVDYPLHIGITEAGTRFTGSIKSAVGIGTLLAEGIGDTLRVSLTGNPVTEVQVGYEILRSLHLRERGITFISCPTCGRTEVDLVPIAEEVERRLIGIDKPLTVAIMGCAVNGPGEAKEADIGIACGKHSALLFKKGEVIEKIPEKDIITRLVREIEQW